MDVVFWKSRRKYSLEDVYGGTTKSGTALKMDSIEFDIDIIKCFKNI